MPPQYAGDPAQHLFGTDRPGRVARAVEHQPVGPRRDKRLHVARGEAEAVMRVGDQRYDPAAAEADHLRIADPPGCGDDYLVALAQRRRERLEDRLLPSG